MKSHPSYFRIAFACVRLRPERRATFLEPPLGLGEQAQWVERAPRPIAQTVSEEDFLSDGGTDTSGELTTAASPTASDASESFTAVASFEACWALFGSSPLELPAAPAAPSVTSCMIAALGSALAVCDGWARLGQVPAVEALEDQGSNWMGYLYVRTLITIPFAAHRLLNRTPACFGMELVSGKDFG